MYLAKLDLDIDADSSLEGSLGDVSSEDDDDDVSMEEGQSLLGRHRQRAAVPDIEASLLQSEHMPELAAGPSRKYAVHPFDGKRAELSTLQSQLGPDAAAGNGPALEAESSSGGACLHASEIAEEQAELDQSETTETALIGGEVASNREAAGSKEGGLKDADGSIHDADISRTLSM